ncbi:MAG: hypothetical protein RI972_1560, partial [Pseudomonadota bacterium]
GFAHARRPPQDEGVQATRFEGPLQRTPRANQMLLAHHILQPLRPQAFGQGRQKSRHC